MIQILLVDDHDIIRAGIRRLLQDVQGIKVIGEAGTGEEAIRLVKEKQPDVILMDVRMPGIGGLEATRKLLRLAPDVKILVVTACDDVVFSSRLLQAGAMGYLTKDCGAEELVRAVKSVYSGQRYIASQVAQALAMKHIDGQTQSPFESLSERELQISMMLTSGQKVAHIAEKLHLSPKTVNSYRYRIFEKLHISSDVELTHLAIKYDLLDATEAPSDTE